MGHQTGSGFERVVDRLQSFGEKNCHGVSGFAPFGGVPEEVSLRQLVSASLCRHAVLRPVVEHPPRIPERMGPFTASVGDRLNAARSKAAQKSTLWEHNVGQTAPAAQELKAGRARGRVALELPLKLPDGRTLQQPMTYPSLHKATGCDFVTRCTRDLRFQRK